MHVYWIIEIFPVREMFTQNQLDISMISKFFTLFTYSMATGLIGRFDIFKQKLFKTLDLLPHSIFTLLSTCKRVNKTSDTPFTWKRVKITPNEWNFTLERVKFHSEKSENHTLKIENHSSLSERVTLEIVELGTTCFWMGVKSDWFPLFLEWNFTLLEWFLLGMEYHSFCSLFYI